MTRTRRAEVRKTPSSLKTMSVSEFVRGGLYDAAESTIVVTHGEPLGMWVPRGQYEALVGMNGTFYGATSSFSTPTADSGSQTHSVMSATALRGSGPVGVTAETISQAVEAAVFKATRHFEESTERTITRLMNEQKGNTNG